MNTRARSIRIPDELWERLAAIAAREDRSVSYIVNRMIEVGLDETGADDELP